MALTQKDKKDIGEIIDGKIKDNNKTLRSKIGEDTKKTVNTEIGLLRLEMNQRFNQTDKKIDGNHKELLEKIDQIRKMESEDIQAVYVDIEKIKKRLPA
jgi:hypothetical protein